MRLLAQAYLFSSPITNITGITKGHPVQLFGALVVLFPFSISAILVGFENLKQGKRYENYQFKGFALVFMMGGFIYLVAIVLAFYITSGVNK